MILLNGVQGREINRANTLSSYLSNNEDIYTLLAPFNKEVKLFFGNTKKINTLIPVKNENGKGITESKNDLKASIASEVNNICALTMVYAVSTGNKELQNAIKVSGADIMKAKDSEVAGLVSSIINTVTPLLADSEFQTYSITQDMLDNLGGEAADFNDKAATIDTGSSIAGKNINEALKAIRGNIVQFDRMMHFFAKDYPDFVEGYQISATINDSGMRHNTVEGTVTNKATGKPIEGAIIKGTSKKRKATSNDKGAYKLDGILSGERTIEVGAPGFETQSLDVTIERGKALKLNISL